MAVMFFQGTQLFSFVWLSQAAPGRKSLLVPVELGRGLTASNIHQMISGKWTHGRHQRIHRSAQDGKKETGIGTMRNVFGFWWA